MRLIAQLALFMMFFLQIGCMHPGKNPADPYEPINREIHKFNMAFDATFLKPPAKLYKAAVPAKARAAINNLYNNVNMIPTVANDILQAEWNFAIKDTWRFIANSTIGIAGIFDVATGFGLPPHSNDLGMTFAKWGDKNSPYIVIPFLGPSTIRDGMGMTFEYALLTPYPYVPIEYLYPILAVRYVDLRAQMLDNDRLIGEAFDQYAFIRDAYLQHRNYLISGKKPEDIGALYVDDEDDDDLLSETPADGTPSEFPLTTAQNASHRPATT